MSDNYWYIKAQEHEATIATLRKALEEIAQWSAAYPETVFTEPDFDRMREVCTAAGLPTAIDAAHGSWGRHLTKSIGEIARAALQGNSTEGT